MDEIPCPNCGSMNTKFMYVSMCINIADAGKTYCKDCHTAFETPK